MLDSGLRPGSASLHTGDSGRKARQPRGARKGLGAIGAKLRLVLLAAAEELWAPPPLRPVAGAASSPWLRDLTARFLLSPRLLLEVRAQVCPIFLPLQWVPKGNGGS